MRKSGWRMMLGIVLLVSSCQTTPKTVFTSRESQTGKLLWKTADRSIVSDAVIQRGQKDDIRLILTKEMGAPLLVITRTGSILEVDDRFKGHHWRGDASRLPLLLIGWSALIDALIATAHLPEGENEIHEAAGWHAIYRKQDGKLQSLDIVSDLSGDRYRLVLDSSGSGR